MKEDTVLKFADSTSTKRAWARKCELQKVEMEERRALSSAMLVCTSFLM